ncbi:MAG: hypothetical protein AVDCRST_MAG56-4939 [uncultured Cytophagales bacterium]|uniref:Uncharacterized protein n=1 Tax=uncultured Cytophagales bacterium TaxID=158755 RepID=A0A6J4K407_9SPHI|nr:MAG: hypothetical protein AVDCRST_MAG56-4939 [uncultured Cytophagales bacterium]
MPDVRVAMLPSAPKLPGNPRREIRAIQATTTTKDHARKTGPPKIRAIQRYGPS